MAEPVRARVRRASRDLNDSGLGVFRFHLAMENGLPPECRGSHPQCRGYPISWASSVDGLDRGQWLGSRAAFLRRFGGL
jgi:hypothetical protein